MSAAGALLTADMAGAPTDVMDPFGLSCNENPFPPLPAVASALRRSFDAANRYPQFLPTRLRRLIARRIGVDDEQVVLGTGASGVAMAALRALTAPADRIVLSHPTFDGYPIFAEMARLKPVTVPLDTDGHQDLATMADAAADARVVVLCRPHNPTGTIEPIADVERFLTRIRSDTVVLLDEAYIEFVAPRDRIDEQRLVRRFPNVVVLRTFSKAYGLAGLRIGYGIGAPQLTGMLWAIQAPFGVSNTSALGVAASYEAEAQLRQRIRRITAERNYLRRHLRGRGVQTTDTHANFAYLLPRGRPWREVLDGAGLQVRHYADGGARITVGHRASTLAVLAAAQSAAR